MPRPDHIHLLHEEAAARFLGELLFLRKKLGLTCEQFAKKAGISRKTLQRWKRGKIPATRAYRVAGKLGLKSIDPLGHHALSGPADFRKAVSGFKELGGGVSRGRLAVAYAVSWLAVAEPWSGLHLHVNFFLGSEVEPQGELLIRDVSDVPRGRVVFIARSGELCYQVHRFVLSEARLVFEGVATEEGFNFCIEFIKNIKSDRPPKQAARINQSLKRILNHERKQHQTGSGPSSARRPSQA